MGHFFRSIRTTQERRQWFACEELTAEYPELRVRGSRSAHMLPESRDEHIRSDWNHKSWKRHRQTQYKAPRVEREKLPRPRVTYDTHEVYRHRNIWWGNAPTMRYRVRDAYRRHKPD